MFLNDLVTHFLVRHMWEDRHLDVIEIIDCPKLSFEPYEVREVDPRILMFDLVLRLSERRTAP